MLLHFAGIHRDRVGEQHQHQGERRYDLDRLRLQREVHHAESRGSEQGAEQEEDGDLGKPGALDRSGEERGDQDHEPDQGEGGDKGLVGHELKYGVRSGGSRQRGGNLGRIMTTNEPAATALLITTWGILLAASVLFGRVSQRAGVPVALLFILVGILAGTEGIGGIPFEDYHFAFRIGYFALALILFDGGLNTPMDAVRRYWAPAGVLATVGVVVTAGLVALCARLMGLGWPESMILGAVVSSTDAAAVFSILRGSGLHLKRRVGVTLELESGLNDPVAVILTTTLTANLMASESVDGWRVAGEMLVQLIAGAAAGLAIAWAGKVVLRKLRLASGGLYPALTLAIAFLAFGVATLIHGSGFLAVYLAGLVLGNSELPYKAGLLRVHDALAWLSQIGMFLILGLLVFPSRLMEVAPVGLGIALLLAFVLRPVTVALCLVPFRYPAKEIAFIGWVGLRGAVPIVLGTFPMLANAPGAERIFNLVFFLVVVSALIPGGTVGLGDPVAPVGSPPSRRRRRRCWPSNPASRFAASCSRSTSTTR